MINFCIKSVWGWGGALGGESLPPLANLTERPCHIYATAGMDISAGSVAAGPNLTGGGMEPGMKTQTFRPNI